MSGPKTSRYTLTAEQRRIIMERRRIQLETELLQKKITEVHNNISRRISVLDSQVEEMESVLKEVGQDFGLLDNLKNVRNQAMEIAIESDGVVKQTNLETLRRTSSKLQQAYKKLQDESNRVFSVYSKKEKSSNSNKECNAAISQNGKMIRICDCGAKNLAQARKCKECGEDISMNPIIQDCDEEEKYILTSIDKEYAYEINAENIIVGREHNMKEYLNKKPYVSRKHAEVVLKQGKLFIKNYSNTNFTFVNNVKISSEKFSELHDGDEIGFGGNSQDGERQQDAAYFIVRISSCI